MNKERNILKQIKEKEESESVKSITNTIDLLHLDQIKSSKSINTSNKDSVLNLSFNKLFFNDSSKKIGGEKESIFLSNKSINDDKFYSMKRYNYPGLNSNKNISKNLQVEEPINDKIQSIKINTQYESAINEENLTENLNEKNFNILKTKLQIPNFIPKAKDNQTNKIKNISNSNYTAPLIHNNPNNLVNSVSPINNPNIVNSSHSNNVYKNNYNQAYYPNYNTYLNNNQQYNQNLYFNSTNLNHNNVNSSDINNYQYYIGNNNNNNNIYNENLTNRTYLSDINNSYNSYQNSNYLQNMNINNLYNYQIPSSNNPSLYSYYSNQIPVNLQANNYNVYNNNGINPIPHNQLNQVNPINRFTTQPLISTQPQVIPVTNYTHNINNYNLYNIKEPNQATTNTITKKLDKKSNSNTVENYSSSEESLKMKKKKKKRIKNKKINIQEISKCVNLVELVKNRDYNKSIQENIMEMKETSDKLIFSRINDKIEDLCDHQFANYIIQKLIPFLSDESIKFIYYKVIFYLLD